MPFVKSLCELLTILMHFHLLKRLFHITNTTFCHWPALKINSVYYWKNYYSPLVYKEMCVYAHIAGIRQSSTFYSEQQEALCVSINGLEQSQIQRWKKTLWSDYWLQERNSSTDCGMQSLLVPSTWVLGEKWWKKTRTIKGKEKREEWKTESSVEG